MNRSAILTLAAILGLAATPALAGDPQPGSPPAAPSETPHHTTSSRLDPNEVVCKRQEESGTRLGGTKICHTRQEWSDIAIAARTSVNDMQTKGNMGLPPH